jgi:hypothetical protein
LLLQIRAQAMNGDLRDTFERWFPEMKTRSEDPFQLVVRFLFRDRGVVEMN